MPAAEESPDEALFQMAVGFRNTAALYVVAKLGIADLLVDGPLDTQELSQKLSIQPRPLFRLMRALAAQGVFTQDTSDRFGLNTISRLLRSDTADSMRYVVIAYGEEQYKSAGDLMHTIKTGETAFDHIYGKGHFDYLAENKEASTTFNLFMTQSSRRSQNPFGSYSFEGKGLIVDVGGGQGALLAHILRSNPRLNGLLYDLPQGVAEARKYLLAQGVLDRCRIVTGSFFDSVPQGGDVYLMSRILHDWPDEKAATILANCRKAISNKGTLLIRDAVIPEGDAPSIAKQVDLTMLYMLGGKERTEKEWRSLLHQSKFELNKIVRTGQAHDLIEASPG